MSARLLLLMAAFGGASLLTLAGVWAFGSEEYGCELHHSKGWGQLICGGPPFKGAIWCEAVWGFIPLGYAPTGYCKVF